MPSVRLPINQRYSTTDSSLYTRVSIQDWLQLKHLPWSRANGYVANKSRGYLHRVILGLEKGDPRKGDHINRDPSDNRRTNLRIVTDAENSQNQSKRAGTSSRYRGVCYFKRTGRWIASIYVSGKSYHLGYFATEDEAGRAVAAARKRLMPCATD